MTTVVDSNLEIGNRKSLLTLQLEKTTVKTWNYLLDKIKKDKFIDFFEFGTDGSSPVSQDLGFNKIMYQNAKDSKIESLELELSKLQKRYEKNPTRTLRLDVFECQEEIHRQNEINNRDIDRKVNSLVTTLNNIVKTYEDALELKEFIFDYTKGDYTNKGAWIYISFLNNFSEDSFYWVRTYWMKSQFQFNEKNILLYSTSNISIPIDDKENFIKFINKLSIDVNLLGYKITVNPYYEIIGDSYCIYPSYEDHCHILNLARTFF